MFLELDRCAVRSFSISDADSIALHANNKKIWIQLRDIFPYPYSKQDALDFINFSINQVPECNFAITVDNKVVGTIGLVLNKDIERFSAEIGYWLGEPFWDRGITTKVLKAVADYAMDKFSLNRIYAYPFVRNTASVRVLEKAGFKNEGTLIRSAFKNKVFEDQYLYALVR